MRRCPNASVPRARVLMGLQSVKGNYRGLERVRGRGSYRGLQRVGGSWKESQEVVARIHSTLWPVDTEVCTL